MNFHTRFRPVRPTRPRSLYILGASLALGLLPVVGVLGCSEEASAEFRSAALDSLRQGLNSIAEGLIAGAIAVAEPNDTSGSDTSTTTTDTSTTGN